MILPGNFAAVDLGSNTFHLVIFRDGGDEPQIVFKMRKAVGIGKNGLERRLITQKALERGIEALLEFKHYIDEHSCKRLEITATSAFRNAENQFDVIREIKLRTGLDVNVISGEEEARLIYEGVKKSIHIEEQNGLIMDIGGGSVEFIICNKNNLLWKESFEIGGIRLMERFHTEDPLTLKNAKELRAHLESALHSLFVACKIHEPTYLIGASGSFDTLCDIRNESNDVEDPLHLSLIEFNILQNIILNKNYDERLKIPGMIAMRAEMISVVCILIKTVIDRCSLEHIQCSQFALKEGMMYRMLKNKKIL